MMMINKRGSTSVFLVFIMAAMIGLTAAFIYAAKQKAYTGISDGAVNLAMRSVLSEYDLTLYERYGLLAFERNGMEAAFKIEEYADYSFDDNSPVKKTSVSFGKYTLSNIEVLKNQILEHMVYSTGKMLTTSEKTDVEINEFEDRTLRNSAVIENLPSKSFEDGGYGFIDKIEQLKEHLGTLEGAFETSSETYIVDSYIMDHFNYATGKIDGEKTFFEHEVEYILVGEYSNRKNREKVESALKLVRIAFNTAYIYSDERKYAQTLAAAELINPAAAPVTQAAIITTWATAEAANDVKLLLKGKTVPLKKTDATWATNLDNVLNNIEEGYIDTGNKKGLYYSDYLKGFLYFENENVKLARVADLIQVNMKTLQSGDFLMKTCNCGMYVTTEIYNRKYEYETCY